MKFANSKCRQRGLAREIVAKAYAHRAEGKMPWDPAKQPDFLYHACGVVWSTWSHHYRDEKKRRRREGVTLRVRAHEDGTVEDAEASDDPGPESARDRVEEEAAKEEVLEALARRLEENPTCLRTLAMILEGKSPAEQAEALDVPVEVISRARKSIIRIGVEIREQARGARAAQPARRSRRRRRCARRSCRR